MIDKKPGLRTIIDINRRSIGALLLLFYGWICWQWTSPEWWGFGLTAFLCLIGGVGQIITVIFSIAKLIKRARAVEQFKQQGGAARADHMAGERDLKDRGMIR